MQLRPQPQDLEILGHWKLQTRNKIESSKIEENVQKCLNLEDDKVKTLANELLQSWADLQLGYRIPKALLVSFLWHFSFFFSFSASCLCLNAEVAPT